MYEIASKTKTMPNNKFIYEFRGKSSYPNPIFPDMATGSVLYDIDTQNIFMYDADAKTWLPQ